MTTNSLPITIKGYPLWQFNLNVAAVCGGGQGWTAMGPLTFDGANYTRTFRQYFPLKQWDRGASVYGVWTSRIPRALTPWFVPLPDTITPPTQQPPAEADTTVVTADSVTVTADGSGMPNNVS